VPLELPESPPVFVAGSAGSVLDVVLGFAESPLAFYTRVPFVFVRFRHSFVPGSAGALLPIARLLLVLYLPLFEAEVEFSEFLLVVCPVVSGFVGSDVGFAAGFAGFRLSSAFGLAESLVLFEEFPFCVVVECSGC